MTNKLFTKKTIVFRAPKHFIANKILGYIVICGYTSKSFHNVHLTHFKKHKKQVVLYQTL